MAKAALGVLGLTSILLLGGATVLLFFVVLSGVTESIPLKDTYFLQADTSNIASARPSSQWTFWNVCDPGNINCGATVPAMPIGAAWVGGDEGVPEALTGSHYKGTTSTYYYYLWRFGWVFYLLSLIFTVIAFFTALLSPFSRLASGFSGTNAMFALFWHSLAAALMTTHFVKVRDVFNAENPGTATLGRYAFGFTWGAWAALAIATVLLLLGVLAGRDRTVTSSRKSFFRRNKSRRSARGSFVDNDSQRRVKEEYA